MNKITFMVMRRMRTPLLILLAAYAISILGLTLIPGQDAQGTTEGLDFFHAFYFVSYMATTIGFGEIPFEFTDAQRFWVLVTIYITVIAWFYAVGAILNLVQDPSLRRVTMENSFERQVNHIQKPFFLVCGFGDTGKALVRSLTNRSIQAVVVDSNAEEIDFLKLQNSQFHIPGLAANAGLPRILEKAGLKHPLCLGVISLANRETINLKVAITSKLLNPALPVICRAETKQFEDNMASFGTDHIIDPFLTFAERLALAVEKPGAFLLYNWLTAVPNSELVEPVFPPRGTWILCGYGRFGKAIHAKMEGRGIRFVTIEPDPQRTQCPPGSITGWGTDACTLQQAGIEEAVGLVAGTEVDVNNLSIVMTAKELNPHLFTIIRQNRRHNEALFNAIRADLVMEPSTIIAREIRVLLTLPLVHVFLKMAFGQSNEWANETICKVLAVIEDTVPEIWEAHLTWEESPAVLRCIERGFRITMADLLRYSGGHQRRPFPALALFRVLESQKTLLPDGSVTLEVGDRILFCGKMGSQSRMRWILEDEKLLLRWITGRDESEGWFWRWIVRHKKGVSEHPAA